MGRKASVDEKELMVRLSIVFRDVGYEGATLTTLSEACGLKKASLYHRFPGGKEQMALEVLTAAGTWIAENILAPLKESGAPRGRVDKMIRRLDEFYSGGRQACLLNILSSALIHEGPFTKPIKSVFQAWIDALAATVADEGFERETARARAERAVALVQGSLVLSRGMGTTRPFRELLKHLPDELFAAVPCG